jgi:hypothetical protein
MTMDWYEIIAMVLLLVFSVWGTAKLVAHKFAKEGKEFFDTFYNAGLDGKYDADELRDMFKEFIDIINVFKFDWLKKATYTVKEKFANKTASNPNSGNSAK